MSCEICEFPEDCGRQRSCADILARCTTDALAQQIAEAEKRGAERMLPPGWTVRPSQISPGSLTVDGPGCSALVDPHDVLHAFFSALPSQEPQG